MDTNLEVKTHDWVADDGSLRLELASNSASSHLQRTRSTLGLHPVAPLDQEHDHDERQKLLWSRVRIALREPFAEFFGTMILVLFGDGSVAQVVLSGNKSGSYQSIAWCWGIGVMLGVYVAGDSGGYLNPAVLFCNCFFRQLPWRRFPIYFIAEVLGAFIGSGIVYANYYAAIDSFEGGPGIRTVPPAPKATAGIFCTYPQPFLSNGTQLISEFVASAILMFVIFALTDRSNNGGVKSSKLVPLCLLFLVYGIGAAFGWQTGYAINLARDFGPRLMSYAVGYGPQVWSAGGYYFWVPMVAPFCGCAFGGLLYDVFIYTGRSPVNTPWLGLKHVFSPSYALKARRERHRKAKDEGIV
ncbi:aquaporin [Byssothecium circinans]|uniref:Aquaporin n=1 Tax=Byssothecium circinans TaxID=147558 RepID=A0A6A5TGJ0_9PLEO|nr:aquaporin [Byssothecium circinans]